MMEACSFRRRLLKMGWLILAPLLLAGCGKNEGTVEGKVTLDGTLVTTGASVQFTSADGQVRSTPVVKDGTYKALNMPLGPMKVAVMSFRPMGAFRKGKMTSGPDEAKGTPSAPAVKIPNKYIHADTSGLSTTVHSGTNKYDIELSSQ